MNERRHERPSPQPYTRRQATEPGYTVSRASQTLVLVVFATLASWLSVHDRSFATSMGILGGGGGLGLLLLSLSGGSRKLRLVLARGMTDGDDLA